MKQTALQLWSSQNSFRDGTIAVYRMLPLRKISHYWGRVNETELPLWMRRPILGGYSKMFKCQMNEAVVEDVAEYKSLGELFRRRLKDGARPVDHDPAKIVSPCDGRVLHFGTVEEDGMLEQIKGWFSLRCHFTCMYGTRRCSISSLTGVGLG